MKPRDIPTIGIIARQIKHQVEATGALERCLTAAGYRTRLSFDRYAPEHIVICWSWGKAEEQRAKDPHKIILCMDHGYTWGRKQGFVNTGWSTSDKPIGLNGNGEHAVVDDGGERSRQYQWDGELYPLRPEGKRALLLGQVFNDAAIRNQTIDYGEWLRGQYDRLVRDGYRVTFRPHPVMVGRGSEAVRKYGNLGRVSTNANLWDDLLNSDLAVGLNSNALVQAYTFGIRAEVFNSGSMPWPLIKEPGIVPFEKREKWWHRMAYTQWTYKELEDGTWLHYHAPILHRLVEGDKSRPWAETEI